MPIFNQTLGERISHTEARNTTIDFATLGFVKAWGNGSRKRNLTIRKCQNHHRLCNSRSDSTKVARLAHIDIHKRSVAKSGKKVGRNSCVQKRSGRRILGKNPKPEFFSFMSFIVSVSIYSYLHCFILGEAWGNSFWGSLRPLRPRTLLQYTPGNPIRPCKKTFWDLGTPPETPRRSQDVKFDFLICSWKYGLRLGSWDTCFLSDSH